MKKWELKPARDLGLTLGERARSLDRESGLMELAANRAWFLLIRSYLAVWHRLKVVGRENLPEEPPFILVANHSSHLDSLSLAAALPQRLRDRTFPIAAGDHFFETPVVAAFAAFVLNALPLWRNNSGPHEMAALRNRLIGDPCSFILFPEGTRSRDGKMTRFRRGVGMLVSGTPVPVVPCYLKGAFESFPPQNRWPRSGKLILRIGEPMTFPTIADDTEGWTEVAGKLEGRVRALQDL